MIGRNEQCLDLADITEAPVGLEAITEDLEAITEDLEDITEDLEDIDPRWVVACITVHLWAEECGTVPLAAEAAAAACFL